MATLTTIIRRETLQIIRDRRTLFVTIVIPLLLLLLFGFAISTEVTDVRIAVAVGRHTDNSRLIVEKLSHNDYFSFEGMVAAPEIEELLRKGKIDAALIINTGGEYQVIVDGTNPTIAEASAAYIRSTVAPVTDSRITMRTLYNPQMKSAYNFVPGIMGMIFILICAIMTSVSIVREKETGSMDLLLVSPVSPRTVIFGKLIPYLGLSCIILAIMLAMAYSVLGLPVSHTVVSVVAVSVLYIALSLSVGLLVSTLVSDQVSALIVSAVMFMIPVILLSGMIFPIENMPRVLQYVSGIIPARWYIAAMRKLMIQQLEFSYVMRETCTMLTMTAVILALAVRKFKSTR